jgi:hypothetical protein
VPVAREFIDRSRRLDVNDRLRGAQFALDRALHVVKSCAADTLVAPSTSIVTSARR